MNFWHYFFLAVFDNWISLLAFVIPFLVGFSLTTRLINKRLK